jgi:hypothetical protein
MTFVTLQRLNRANLTVTNELEALGFYDALVQGIDVYLVPFGLAYGWQFYGTTGVISIPAVSFSRLWELMGGVYTSLRDVLRHEYGHAIADTHRGLLRSRRFADAFGSHHTWDFAWEYDPCFHVTVYAATSPAEDFAEVFMQYLKYGGKIPTKFRTPSIVAKWKYIHSLGKAISGGLRKW